MQKNSIQQKQEKIIQEFVHLENWEDRYKKIIDFGKKLENFPEEFRKVENKVKGCQSQVWLHAIQQADGTIKFFGDSDALLVKGLVAVVLAIYSESSPAEILSTQPEFLKKMGFFENLSPSRANGLVAMLKQIKLYAAAFSAIH